MGVDSPRLLSLMQALVRFSHIAAGDSFSTPEIHADRSVPLTGGILKPFKDDRSIPDGGATSLDKLYRKLRPRPFASRYPPDRGFWAGRFSTNVF